MGEMPAAATTVWTDDVRSHVLRTEQQLRRELNSLRQVWTDEAAPAVNPEGPLWPDVPTLLQSLVLDGGKRLRPVMVYLGWVCADGAASDEAYDTVIGASVALEFLHAFALVHDDVMDESDTRRGRRSVHRQAAAAHEAARGRGPAQRFGESVAVLLGDLAHAEADRLAADLPPALRTIWRALSVELVAGQMWDLTGTATGHYDLPFARSLARQKSGAYTVGRPLQLGAVAADASAAVLDCLAGYGRHAGEAFALRDDLLGVFGDDAATGKPAGDDLRSGKPTVLLALAHQRLRGSARRRLERVGDPSMTDADVRELRDAMTDAGLPLAVEALIVERVEDATAALDPSVLAPDGVAGLTGAAHELSWRGQ